MRTRVCAGVRVRECVRARARAGVLEEVGSVPRGLVALSKAPVVAQAPFETPMTKAYG